LNPLITFGTLLWLSGICFATAAMTKDWIAILIVSGVLVGLAIYGRPKNEP
jgi:hypothetical protein